MGGRFVTTSRDARRRQRPGIAARERIRGVVAIDLDGTLLPGTSVLRLLASELGASGLVDRLERDFSAGTIGNERVADLTAALFRGAQLRQIEGVLAAAQWLPGISDAVERLGETGCRTLLATVTWSFAAEIVACRFGFDGWCGTRMNNVRGRLTGMVESYFRPTDKAAYALEECRLLGLSSRHLIAIGDSRSDCDLFRVSGLSIAVNGTPDAVSEADVSMGVRDLGEVVPVAVAYLESIDFPS